MPRTASLVGFARNPEMTRRKQIEEALRASENRFRTIFEGSALGIETGQPGRATDRLQPFDSAHLWLRSRRAWTR
jgi:PAS domain-containing protein